MGKYARHRCSNCQIIRPAYNMRQVEFTKKSGHVGFGLSFNPQREKSARIQLPRNFYRKSSKWICKTDSACNDPNYFKRLEIEAKILSDKNALIKRISEIIEKSVSLKFEIWNKVYSDRDLYNYDIWNDDKRSILLAIDDQVKYGNLKFFKKDFDSFYKQNENVSNKVFLFNSFEVIWKHLHKEMKKFLNFNLKKNIYKYIKLDTKTHEQYCPLTIFSFKEFKKTEKKIFDQSKEIVLRRWFGENSTFIQKFDNLLLSYEQHLNNWFFKKIKQNVCKDKFIAENIYFAEIYKIIFGEDYTYSKKMFENNSKLSVSENSELIAQNKKTLKELYYHTNFFDLITCIYGAKIMIADGNISDQEKAKFMEITNIKDNSKQMELVYRVVKIPNYFSIVGKLFNKKYSKKDFKFQLINNLCFIAEADSKISDEEINEIKKISKLIGLSNNEIKNIIDDKFDKHKKENSKTIDEFDEIFEGIDFYENEI